MAYRIDHTIRKYGAVGGGGQDQSNSCAIADGSLVFVSRFVCNSITGCLVILYWDFGGNQETVIASSGGNIDSQFRDDDTTVQFTGDGTKRFSIIRKNNNLTESQIFGASVEISRLC